MQESDFITTKIILIIKKNTISRWPLKSNKKKQKTNREENRIYDQQPHGSIIASIVNVLWYNDYEMLESKTWWHHRQRQTVFPDVHGRSFALGYVHKQPPRTEDEKLLKIAFSNQIYFLGFFLSIIINPLHALHARLTTIFHLFPVTRNLALIVSLLAAAEIKKSSANLRLQCNTSGGRAISRNVAFMSAATGLSLISTPVPIGPLEALINSNASLNGVINFLSWASKVNQLCGQSKALNL